MSLQILRRDTLPLGGFAGLKEHRLLMDPRLFGRHTNPNTWAGIANLVYLSDAQFNPHGETHLHDHKEIDVISILLILQQVRARSTLRAYNLAIFFKMNN